MSLFDILPSDLINESGAKLTIDQIEKKFEVIVTLPANFWSHWVNSNLKPRADNNLINSYPASTQNEKWKWYAQLFHMFA